MAAATLMGIVPVVLGLAALPLVLLWAAAASVVPMILSPDREREGKP